jgi:UDP-N-acetylmuramoyl-tripeptide--D-alanyl-D-alanine ligase
MEPRSLKYVADSCGGELLRGSADTVATRICTDSRSAEPGDVFVALTGERFDGHDFLVEVAQRASRQCWLSGEKFRDRISHAR